MPTRRQLIQKITLNSNASSVTFSNIPRTYSDLLLLSSARCTTTDDYFWIRFNGVSTNLSGRSIYGQNGSTVASLTIAPYARMVGSDRTANTFSSNRIYIPNYAGSTNKSLLVNAMYSTATTVSLIDSVAGLWSSTDAITEINLVPNSGNFAANSTFYLYGITQVPIIRGGEVSIRDGFKYHTFKSSGSLQVIEPGDVEYLVVAGGGGGGGGQAGSWAGSGGGAGGMLSGRTRLAQNVFAIAVGGGGAGGARDNAGVSGTASSLSTISANGGGNGACNGQNGGNGGSGGGQAAYSSASNSAVGTGISGQGNNGGSSGSTTRAGGGGGGAGAVGNSSSGSSISSQNGANGGAGLASSITGTSVFYAGGGGSGAWVSTSNGGSSATGGSGGQGGGGAGGSVTSTTQDQGASGSANTGGGGGGGSTHSNLATPGVSGGTGGSGIVIIRYPYDGN